MKTPAELQAQYESNLALITEAVSTEGYTGERAEKLARQLYHADAAKVVDGAVEFTPDVLESYAWIRRKLDAAKPAVPAPPPPRDQYEAAARHMTHDRPAALTFEGTQARLTEPCDDAYEKTREQMKANGLELPQWLQ